MAGKLSRKVISVKNGAQASGLFQLLLDDNLRCGYPFGDRSYFSEKCFALPGRGAGASISFIFGCDAAVSFVGTRFSAFIRRFGHFDPKEAKMAFGYAVGPGVPACSLVDVHRMESVNVVLPNDDLDWRKCYAL
ncbi:hypothetical protein VQ056_31635 [Paenibacillus sp. JTLBN-2024]|uniref:hypothetical protein n=1 Tax=Paenibacillus cookii TaxID=157839 RepID=UPI001BB3A677|nr:hypothetical protein [Paenibacillus cookii]